MKQEKRLELTLFVQGGVSDLTAGMPGGNYAELGGSLPALASLNASYSTSLSLPSPYLPVRAISDVRRTFCLFVTFDLLFISLLWIIEMNVSETSSRRVDGSASCFDSALLSRRSLERSGKTWKIRLSDITSSLLSLT